MFTAEEQLINLYWTKCLFAPIGIIHWWALSLHWFYFLDQCYVMPQNSQYQIFIPEDGNNSLLLTLMVLTKLHYLLLSLDSTGSVGLYFLLCHLTITLPLLHENKSHEKAVKNCMRIKLNL